MYLIFGYFVVTSNLIWYWCRAMVVAVVSAVVIGISILVITVGFVRVGEPCHRMHRTGDGLRLPGLAGFVPWTLVDGMAEGR